MFSELPRFSLLYKDIQQYSRKSSFFNSFANRIDSCAATFKFYKVLDNGLSWVPENQWEILVKKIHKVINRKHEIREFHEVLYEALGFWYLRTIQNVDQVKYIPEKQTRTPDFKACTQDITIFCEQKTKNTSDEDNKRYMDDLEKNKPQIVPDRSTPTLDSAKKLLNTIISNATEQLTGFELETQNKLSIKKILFIVLLVDTVYDSYFRPLIEPFQQALDTIYKGFDVEVLIYHHQVGWNLIRNDGSCLVCSFHA